MTDSLSCLSFEIILINKQKFIYTPSFTKYLIGYIIAVVVIKMSECCQKKTIRSEDEKKKIINRLNRIKGQITGIEKMVNNDTYCNDILIQVVAVEKSMKSLANSILENHLYRCVAEDLEKGNLEVIDELISLFKRFNN